MLVDSSHRKDRGFVLILFVLAVAASIAVVFTSVSLHIYPWLEVAKHEKEQARARSDLLFCRDIFLRNMAANFFLDEDVSYGEEYYTEGGITCVFESSETISSLLLQKIFPSDTYDDLRTQYPENVDFAKYKVITLVSRYEDGEGYGEERRIYVCIYSSLFLLKEIQSFLFV